MPLRATLGFQKMCAILSYDSRNACNSMFRSRILPAVATIARNLIGYANDLYARSPPDLLSSMEDVSVQVSHSSRGAQRGRGLGPLFYSAGLLRLRGTSNRPCQCQVRRR